MTDAPFNPATYLADITDEIPAYRQLQEHAVAATGGGAHTLLELCTGTGETACRVLRRHPGARLIGIDVDAAMLEVARRVVPDAELRCRRLQDPLPAGPFDVVFSVLCVHHLDEHEKADLFRRVAQSLAPAGRFVIGDLVVPEHPDQIVTVIDDDYDKPSRVDQHQAWLSEAGLASRVAWRDRDLVVIVAEHASTVGG